MRDFLIRKFGSKLPNRVWLDFFEKKWFQLAKLKDCLQLSPLLTKIRTLAGATPGQRPAGPSLTRHVPRRRVRHDRPPWVNWEAWALHGRPFLIGRIRRQWQLAARRRSPRGEADANGVTSHNVKMVLDTSEKVPWDI